MIDIHHKTGIPLIATNDAHYLRREDEQMHKILVCIGTNTRSIQCRAALRAEFLSRNRRRDVGKVQARSRSAGKHAAHRRHGAILELDLKTTHFPNFDVPAGHDLVSFLRELCKQRFDKRYPAGHPRRAEAIPRMEYELRIIIQKGYPVIFWWCRISSTGAKSAAFWSAVAAARRAVWCRMCWASPTSIRCLMACCSSVF